MQNSQQIFKLHSEYQPTGDQPQAIEKLVKGFQEGNQCETLLGVTGSGKTFTMANVIARLNKPTLIIAHNKTLAAQLYGEFKEFFPENAVEYFVSYYDYYQPEAYVPSSDTYIAKDSARNDEIDKLRLSATSALSERNDVIVVSSVSCIYGIGSPKDYMEMIISLRPGMEKDRDDVIRQLIDIQYDRNDMDFHRGTFRVRGDVLEIFPAEETDKAVRVEFFGDEIDRLVQIDTLTGEILCELNHIAIFPASHYVVPMDTILKATGEIEKDMEEQVKFFKHEGKLIEAQRIEERTNFDIEMLKETGICSGIENYSRYLSGLKPGEPPYTLMDYFGDDFLIIVDESHKTVPQIRSMYAGDQSRKSTLVDYGFRLPSAKDNRPLNFGEFEDRIDQILFVSATPGDYEADHELLRAEQIIRPTGLPITDGGIAFNRLVMLGSANATAEQAATQSLYDCCSSMISLARLRALVLGITTIDFHSKSPLPGSRTALFHVCTVLQQQAEINVRNGERLPKVTNHAVTTVLTLAQVQKLIFRQQQPCFGQTGMFPRGLQQNISRMVVISLQLHKKQLVLFLAIEAVTALVGNNGHTAAVS